jgi:hypothetical protein
MRQLSTHKLATNPNATRALRLMKQAHFRVVKARGG